MVFDKNMRMSEFLDIQKEDIVIRCSLDEWLVRLCDKKYNELDCNDVIRMIQQNIGKIIGFRKAFDILSESPMCGKYDWHLFEIITEHFDEIKSYTEDFIDMEYLLAD